jgi:hypothetical protein
VLVLTPTNKPVFIPIDKSLNLLAKIINAFLIKRILLSSDNSLGLFSINFVNSDMTLHMSTAPIGIFGSIVALE